jgi:hypothetical protein
MNYGVSSKNFLSAGPKDRLKSLQKTQQLESPGLITLDKNREHGKVCKKHGS